MAARDLPREVQNEVQQAQFEVQERAFRSANVGTSPERHFAFLSDFRSP
jgi:hypothetical protein